MPSLCTEFHVYLELQKLFFLSEDSTDSELLVVKHIPIVPALESLQTQIKGYKTGKHREIHSFTAVNHYCVTLARF